MAQAHLTIVMGMVRSVLFGTRSRFPSLLKFVSILVYFFFYSFYNFERYPGCVQQVGMAILSKYKKTVEELRQSGRETSNDYLWKQARFDLNSSGEYIRCKETIKTAVISIIKSGAVTTLSASDLKGKLKTITIISKGGKVSYVKR